MMTNIEIAQALATSGYLSEADIEAAAALLANAFSADEAAQALAAAIRDEASQEQMVTGASAMAEQDAARGDKKGLEVDRRMVQDAINQEQVDEVIIRDAESKITSTSKATAALLAAEGLIEKTAVDDVAGIISSQLGVGGQK